MNPTEIVQFKNPAKINAGFHALETIPMELMRRGVYRPMLLLDSTCRKMEKHIIKGFQGSNMALLIEYSDGHMDIAAAVAGLVRGYHANGCDAIIAAGPPTLLDIARLLNVAVSQQGSFTSLSNLAVTDHPRPLVAVIFEPGQALHVTESIRMETYGFEAVEIMPSLIVIDDCLSNEAKWQSALSCALAALNLASETLAFGPSVPFTQVYAHSALKEIVSHLPPAISTSKSGSRTSLLAAELHAGLSAGRRDHHPTWALSSQIALQLTFSRNIIAALVLPSTLAHMKRSPGGRVDLLLSALGGSDFYSMVAAKKFDPWEKAVECLNIFLDRVRLLKPGYLPQNLFGFGVGADQIAAMATKAADSLDTIWDIRSLKKILRHSVMMQPHCNDIDVNQPQQRDDRKRAVRSS
jgi:alcohol dehydrogenase class IV